MGVTVGKKVSFIGDYAFNDCTSLKSISMSSSNPNYISLSGVLYDKGRTRLILYPTAKTDTSFTVEVIATDAFSGVTALKTVKLNECTMNVKRS